MCAKVLAMSWQVVTRTIAVSYGVSERLLQLQRNLSRCLSTNSSSSTITANSSSGRRIIPPSKMISSSSSGSCGSWAEPSVCTDSRSSSSKSVVLFRLLQDRVTPIGSSSSSRGRSSKVALTETTRPYTTSSSCWSRESSSSGSGFLASLVNYEVQGIPDMAGVAPPAAASAAATGTAGGSTAFDSSSKPPAAAAASGSSFDLEYMRALLSALGNPHQQYPIIHVAGTKGKGSVVALLSAMLRAAGYKVGTYTSPHLLHAVERIQGPEGQGPTISIREWRVLEGAVAEAAGRLKEGNPLAAAAAAGGGEGGGGGGGSGGEGSMRHHGVTQTAPAAALGGRDAEAAVVYSEAGGGNSTDDGSRHSKATAGAVPKDPSYFEAVTAMAIKHFADAGADIAVIETGLGGATDATNVIEADQLQLAVITSLGLDHVQALGGSSESIAAAKAGIMKRGRPVVVAAQRNAEQQKVLLEVAREKGCPVVMAESAVQVKKLEGGYSWGGRVGLGGAVAVGPNNLLIELWGYGQGRL